ncbi:MAG: CBS domain-containing protein [Alphaproteobacteria bacterium]|nr:CBS domain-containing protein [Alphaproteobacteria bacterium]
MSPSPTTRDYMSTDLVTFAPDTDIHRAIGTLLEKRISGAPVVDERGQLVGILSSKDCLRVAFSASYHQEPGGTVSDYMSREVKTVDAAADIVAVAEMFVKGPYRRFPVMENGRLVGLLSRHDILKAIEDLW